MANIVGKSMLLTYVAAVKMNLEEVELTEKTASRKWAFRTRRAGLESFGDCFSAGLAASAACGRGLNLLGLDVLLSLQEVEN